MLVWAFIVTLVYDLSVHLFQAAYHSVSLIDYLVEGPIYFRHLLFRETECFHQFLDCALSNGCVHSFQREPSFLRNRSNAVVEWFEQNLYFILLLADML